MRASRSFNVRRCLIGVIACVSFGLSGCGKPESKPLPPEGAADSAKSSAPSAEASTPANGTPEPQAAQGWPAGDDPKASVETLRQQIEKTFNDLKLVESLIYPMGWTQRRYPAQSVTAEVVESDADGRPKKLLVKLVYQKLNSVVHPTQKAAAADTELLPYPAAETREEMTGHRVDRRWPPTEAEITYELKDGRWVRTAYQTKVVGREGADWLDQIGIP